MNNESQVLNVPIEDIIPNRFQPRLNFDDAGLKELSSSIKEHGIIQPLVLRRLGDKFEIIAGERRYKAAKMAGLSNVPAIISALDDRKSAEVAIVENIQRRDLSSIEEAKSYKALLDKGYLTQEELAKKMGLSQSAISNKLRLLSLSEKVQDALMKNKISERHARSLLQLEDKNKQEEWLEKIIEERLTVRDLDSKLKLLKESVKEEEIPLIEFAPNLDEIREKSVDIISQYNEFEDILPRPIIEEKIPNKFFNYLEDEVVNMNTVEQIEEIESPEEEIELLDFEVPVVEVDEISDIPKNMDLAKNLVEKLAIDLKNNNYDVKIEINETTNELTYTIVIK